MATQTYQFNASLIPFTSPVFYQGSEGDCSGAMEYNVVNVMQNLDGDHFGTVNAQTLYNMNLITQNQLGHDIGVNPTSFLQNLQTIGIPTLDDIHYGVQNDGITPSAADYANAKTHTATFAEISNWSSTQENYLAYTIAQYLLQGKPVEMAFNVCSGMIGEINQHSLSQQTGNDTGAIEGGHFADIIAVNTQTNMLTLETWGAPNGDNGLINVSLDSFYPPIGQPTNYTNALNLFGLYVETGLNGVDLTQNIATQEVAAAFVGILNRASALAGMQAYEAEINSGANLSNICDQIINSTEFQKELGGDLSNTKFINTIFQNVLGRQAASGGLMFYGNELASGMTRGQIAAQIITDGQAQQDWVFNTWIGDGSLHATNPNMPAANPDPNMYNESLVFNNKIQGAQDFAITCQAGPGHTDIATSYIASITSDPGTILANLIGVPQALGHANFTPIHP